MSGIDMSFTAQRRRILLDESLIDIDLDGEDIPVKVDHANGTPEAVLEETVGSVEETVNEMHGYLFGHGNENGFCGWMKESVGNIADSIVAMKEDQKERDENFLETIRSIKEENRTIHEALKVDIEDIKRRLKALEEKEETRVIEEAKEKVEKANFRKNMIIAMTGGAAGGGGIGVAITKLWSIITGHGG